MLASKLNYGDTIGVIGVSNSIDLDENGYEVLCKAEEFFVKKGFKVKRGKYVLENYYGSAGTREQKAEDMMNMFKDKEVKAIICLTGGETCNTFIDLLDYEVIKLIESYKTTPNECQMRFAHLKQYGMFDKIKGIIVGYNYDLQKNGDIYPQMEDILLYYTKEYNFPIIKCNDFGHKIINSIIPIGVNIQINSEKSSVEIMDEFLM